MPRAPKKQLLVFHVHCNSCGKHSATYDRPHSFRGADWRNYHYDHCSYSDSPAIVEVTGKPLTEQQETVEREDSTRSLEVPAVSSSRAPVSFREAPRHGMTEVPVWQVTWFNREQNRHLAEELYSEGPTMHYAEGLAKDPNNENIRAVRVDWFEIQLYPEPTTMQDGDVDGMSFESLTREVRYLRRINREQGIKLKEFINAGRKRSA